MWLVIWLSGIAILTIEAGNVDLCEQQMLPAVVADIQSGVIEIDRELFVQSADGELLPWAAWQVTCEIDLVEIGDAIIE